MLNRDGVAVCEFLIPVLLCTGIARGCCGEAGAPESSKGSGRRMEQVDTNPKVAWEEPTKKRGDIKGGRSQHALYHAQSVNKSYGGSSFQEQEPKNDGATCQSIYTHLTFAHA